MKKGILFLLLALVLLVSSISAPATPVEVDADNTDIATLTDYQAFILADPECPVGGGDTGGC